MTIKNKFILIFSIFAVLSFTQSCKHTESNSAPKETPDQHISFQLDQNKVIGTDDLNYAGVDYADAFTENHYKLAFIISTKSKNNLDSYLISVTLQDDGVGSYEGTDVSAYVRNLNTGQSYSHRVVAGSLSSATVTVSENNETYASGSINLSLCHMQSIPVNTCDIPENQLSLSGDFVAHHLESIDFPDRNPTPASGTIQDNTHGNEQDISDMSLPLILDGDFDTYAAEYSIQLPVNNTFTIRLKQKSHPSIYLSVAEYTTTSGENSSSISFPAGPICTERFLSPSHSECVVTPSKNNTLIQVQSNYQNTGSFLLEIEKTGEKLSGEGSHFEPYTLGTTPLVWHGTSNYKGSYYTFSAQKNTRYKIIFISEDGGSTLFINDDNGNGRGCNTPIHSLTATCITEPRSETGEQRLSVFLEIGIDKSTYSIQVEAIE